MKYWINHLPLEVWVDVYCYPWISREELGRIVHRFGNRKYAEYLQFYLHDWGKRKLKGLHFDEDGVGRLIGFGYIPLGTDLPLTPMPGNIKSFECISFSHFDARFIAFLRQIGPILTNVNLDFCNSKSPKDMDNLRTILDNLLPSLDGVHSLCFDAVLCTRTRTSYSYSYSYSYYEYEYEVRGV